ncbi:hypothetical protein GCM10022261_17390 [Brevibacterium daeguense]|uniref:Cache domain-containing protein n=1 Tax=Brevibacterium daeguense TaxID=909936 RepID=A0ABP8EJT6_9MICO|nr:cache domain-containing protein [Brevibacterium daeguense]
MTRSEAVEASQVIAAWLDSLFERLEALGDALTAELAECFAGEPPYEVSRKARSQLEVRVGEFLKENPHLDGAGLIFQLALLKPSKAKLEWWVRDGDSYSRQDFILDPDSERFYDYEYLEWFRGGFNSEVRTIAGPYIDHLGIDDYVVTMTVPAYVAGEKVGVAGMDMLMRDVESTLLRMLAPLGQGAAVLSRHNQVLVGTSGEFSSGVRVSAVPEGYGRIPIKADQLGLSLLYRT